MAASEKQLIVPGSRGRRIRRWMVQGVIVLVVLGAGAYAVVRYWAARTIRAEIVKIRAVGEAVSISALGGANVGRAVDAGPYYSAAQALVKPMDEEGDEANLEAFTHGLVSSGGVTLEQRAWAERAVEKNRRALELLDTAAELPGCNADIQLHLGVAVGLTHFGPLRVLLEAGSLRTRVLALRGEGDAAVDSVVASLGVIRVLERQPVMIDTLVQWAMVQRVCWDAAVVLSFGRPSEGALLKLEAALRRAEPIRLRQMLIGERAYFLEVVEGAGPSPLPESQMATRGGLFLKVVTARALPVFAEMIAGADADWAEAAARVSRISAGRGPKWVSLQLLDEGFRHSVTIGQRAAASHRGVLVAIAVERYRQAHGGKVPETLGEVPGASGLPRDPFGGEAMVYVKGAEGYTVRGSNQGAVSEEARSQWMRYGGVEVRVRGE